MNIFVILLDEQLKLQELQAIVDKADINNPLVTSMDEYSSSSSKHIKTPENESKLNSAANKSQQKLPFDRQVIVNELSDLLVLNGINEVMPEEVEKLVDFFLVMCKIVVGKHFLDNRPLTVADFKLLLDFVNKTRKRKRRKRTKRIDSSTECSSRNENPATSSSHTSDNLNELNKDEEVPTETLSTDIMIDNNDDDEKNNSPDTKKNESESIDNNLLESLTDSDLQTLLKNFKRLLSEEQHHLILYLRRLESTDMERVEKLRKYVNLDDSAEENENTSGEVGEIQDDNNSMAQNNEEVNSDNPNSLNTTNTNINPGTSAEVLNVDSNKFSLDDDEDDYNFDEVCKTVSMKINKPSQEKRKININLHTNSLDKLSQSSTQKTSVADAEKLVANIMNTLRKRNCTNTPITNPSENGELKAVSDSCEIKKSAKGSSTVSKPNIKLTCNGGPSIAQNLVGNSLPVMSNIASCDFNPPQQGQAQYSKHNQQSAEMTMTSEPSLYEPNRPFYQQQQHSLMYNQYAASTGEPYYNFGENYGQNYKNGNNMMKYDQWQSMQQGGTATNVQSADGSTNYNPYVIYQQDDPTMQTMY